MSPPVLILMYLLAPIAWPTAKLLDWLLGEDHGTVYKKSGLKTLVTLHKTLGPSPGDRLNQDEVTIISAVLDLKDKPVGDIMTPMDDVFIMSADTVLDEETMDIILSAGYSRIPIHEPGNERNFIGMLLVKILITYDPEDCKRVSEFALATLPETRPETSCLDIVNFFQEGKSHMVLVSEFPGENFGAMGVVTLEDVIEELIGEYVTYNTPLPTSAKRYREIIDESDVYIDVHKAIRRLAPAPKARVQKGQVVTDPDAVAIPEDHLLDLDIEGELDGKSRDRINSVGSRTGNGPHILSTSRDTTFMLRRSSATPDGSVQTVRGNAIDMREHLKHLGPSNLASRPKSTRYNTVKIKPGLTRNSESDGAILQPVISEEPYRDNPAPQGGEGEGLLKSAGKDASDGVQAVQQGYGTTNPRSSQSPGKENIPAKADTNGKSRDRDGSPKSKSQRQSNSDDSDTMGSLPSKNGSPAPRKRNPARSGSITENIIDAGGVRKVVLETNSSSEDHEQEAGQEIATNDYHERSGHEDTTAKAEQVKKKRRRKRKALPKEEGAGKPGGSSG
jgi:metal transporter CNNM